jgi:hypothetical protein
MKKRNERAGKVLKREKEDALALCFLFCDQICPYIYIANNI